MDEPELIRDLKRGRKNWITFCAIVDAVAASIILILLERHPDTEGWIAVYALGLIGAACTWSLVATLTRNLSEEDDVKTLCAKEKQSLAELAQAVQAEIDASGQSGELLLLPSWIYLRNIFDVNLVRLDDVAWVHKKVVQHRVNFVPTDKSVSVIIHWFKTDRRGQVNLRRMMSVASEAEVDLMIERVARHVPWAIIGYDPSLENNPGEVMARVRAKRAEPTGAAFAP